MTHGDFNNHNLMETRFCSSSSIVNRNTELSLYMRIGQTCEWFTHFVQPISKIIAQSIDMQIVVYIHFHRPFVCDRFQNTNQNSIIQMCYYARMQTQQLGSGNVTKLIGISLIFGYFGIFGEYYLLCKTTDALPSVTSSDWRINGKMATWQFHIDCDFLIEIRSE